MHAAVVMLFITTGRDSRANTVCGVCACVYERDQEGVVEGIESDTLRVCVSVSVCLCA